MDIEASWGHSLLVHATAKCFDVVADVGNHSVPFVSLRDILALVRSCGIPASSDCSVAVGGGIGGGASRAFAAAEAVCDDAAAVLHSNGLQEVFKVLAVLLRNEGTQA